MPDQTTSVLVHIKDAPYGNTHFKDALDVVLTCAAFDMPVTLALSKYAATALLENQQADAIGQKSLLKQLSALPMYDIDTLWVDESAASFLGTLPVGLTVKYFNKDEWQNLIHSHTRLMSF
jgi:tRNA 2-thiouridine synthesizing protein C